MNEEEEEEEERRRRRRRRAGKKGTKQQEGRRIYLETRDSIPVPRPRGRARNTWARYFTLVGEENGAED